MKPTVYLETTIIGYFAMRLSRDLLFAHSALVKNRDTPDEDAAWANL